MTGGYAHQTVLLEEAVTELVVRPGGRYVDGTFGRGGHSRLILERLAPEGWLLAIDKDPEAVADAANLARKDDRMRVRQGSFAELDALLGAEKVKAVDGILLDLGVSSPQLDDPLRGFSFVREGPLDMRMDPTRGMSAREWLQGASEAEIVHVLKTYGEERFARRIARRILEVRGPDTLKTTAELAALVAEAVPRRDPHKHPATRVFQAIRIQVNRELDDLREGLEVAANWLAPGGRLVVISFHSLEDRIVKRFMRDKVRGPQVPRGLPVRETELETGFRQPVRAIRPTDEETRRNARARSAIMRVLERQ